MMMAPNFATFGRAATAAVEFFKLIDRQSDIDAFDQSGSRPDSVNGGIEIRGVSFMYPTRPDTTVLDNLTLSIPAGKVTALVVSAPANIVTLEDPSVDDLQGPSGSGKSTIIGLIERWYNPVAGAIELDGQDISSLNLAWLRTNIRLVQQASHHGLGLSA
jgi:ATP-binding cassette subfamily B (MDR/TAP) protein 1